MVGTVSTQHMDINMNSTQSGIPICNEENHDFKKAKPHVARCGNKMTPFISP